MLFRIARLLAFSGILAGGLHGQAAFDNADANKTDDLYWIVDSKDVISIRSGTGAEHALKGHFTVLRPSDEVYCTVEVPPPPPPSKPASGASRAKVASPPSPDLPTCALTYVTPTESNAILTDKIPPNHWVLMASIKDLPKPVRVVKSQRDLLEEMGRKTQRAGLSKGSGCAGNLPVVVPVCRDAIDITDFTLEWTDPAGGGTFATLFIDTIDEIHSQSIRLDRIPLSLHHYEDPRLRKFFETVQKDSTPTNLVLRLSQSQNVEATRIVTIPSLVDQKAMHEALEIAQERQPLIRAISLLSIYIEFGLWSKAGRQARELLAIAPDEELAMTYALIGFCHSGYDRETAELRTSLNRLGITDICPESQE